MKDLAKWQVISFISRLMAMGLGIIQSFVIIRLLSVAEWGIIQLAISIGGALGIYQHLGLASASTREISAAKDDTHVFKIFVTSAVIRYFITGPIALGLILFSNQIATGIYKHPELTLPLQIYGVTLLFQGVQSILNSVISGTKRFKQLFTYQVLISVLSVVLYVPLVYLYRIPGYFYAYFIFNVLNSIFLAIIAFKPLRGNLVWPSKKDFKVLFGEIFSISMAIYLVKVITTNWEKFGTNILGLNNTAEVVAILAFAMLYAKKIMSISDSVTDVTLPILSEKYVHNMDDFKETFSKNFNKVFALIILAASVALYWAPDIIGVVVGKTKYVESYPYILPVLLAYVLYSFADIIKSSVLIPAKMTWEMIVCFVLMLLVTGGTFYSLKGVFSAITLMSWSMAIGVIFSLIFMIVLVKNRLKFSVMAFAHLLIVLQGFLLGWIGVSSNTLFKYPFLYKSILFLPAMLLLLTALASAKYLTVADIMYAKAKVLNKLKLRGRK